MPERWSRIDGSPYEVSDAGRIRRGTRILSQHKDDGYPRITLWFDGKRRTVKTHVYVALAFLGPRPDGHQINHKDGVRGNNRADNLEYVSPLENTRHAIENGYWPGNNHRVLDADAVRSIRAEHKAGDTRVAIARRHGVSTSAIWSVLSGRTWGWVNG